MKTWSDKPNKLPSELVKGVSFAVTVPFRIVVGGGVNASSEGIDIASTPLAVAAIAADGMYFSPKDLLCERVKSRSLQVDAISVDGLFKKKHVGIAIVSSRRFAGNAIKTYAHRKSNSKANAPLGEHLHMAVCLQCIFKKNFRIDQLRVHDLAADTAEENRSLSRKAGCYVTRQCAAYAIRPFEHNGSPLCLSKSAMRENRNIKSFDKSEIDSSRTLSSYAKKAKYRNKSVNTQSHKETQRTCIASGTVLVDGLQSARVFGYPLIGGAGLRWRSFGREAFVST